MVNAFAFTFFAGLAAAATVADFSGPPSGNPIITPETNGDVEAGKPFDITWTATTKGTVTLYYCKGPPTNCVNSVAPIADAIANDGSFTWDVPTTLEPSTEQGLGYGIQIVSDQDNTKYQFSGQFGIINPDFSSASPTGKPTNSGQSTEDSSPSSTEAPTYATVTGGANSTVVYPTKSLSVPNSLKTTVYSTATLGGNTPSGTTSSGPIAQTTNAAPIAQIGLGAVFGGVVAMLAL